MTTADGYNTHDSILNIPLAFSFFHKANSHDLPTYVVYAAAIKIAESQCLDHQGVTELWDTAKTNTQLQSMWDGQREAEEAATRPWGQGILSRKGVHWGES